MVNLTGVVNTPLTFYFKAPSGQVIFVDAVLVCDGEIIPVPSLTISEIATSGIYTVTYTPTQTGRFCFFVNQEIIAQFDVQSRSIFSFLTNLEDEALGSWVWDKQAGTLEMVRQNGTTLASFDVVENLTIASRERTIVSGS